MARIRFYPRNMASGGCSRLRDELRRRGHNVFKVRGNGAYRPRLGDTVINWGNETVPAFYRTGSSSGIKNIPANVRVAQNKLETFRRLQANNVSIPPFTTDRASAQVWLNEGHEVLVRTLLESSGGRGIEVYSDRRSQIPRAPLYVQYIKKMNEYRVHVFNGQVIDITEKKRRREFDGERDAHIRNLDNGYVFVRDNVQAHESVGPLAIAAVQALGLDFGAVDIIYNRRRNQAYVLEVNTAPGLEGTTVERYADAIESILRTPRPPAPINRPRATTGRMQSGTGPINPDSRPRFNNDRDNDNTEF